MCLTVICRIEPGLFNRHLGLCIILYRDFYIIPEVKFIQSFFKLHVKIQIKLHISGIPKGRIICKCTGDHIMVTHQCRRVGSTLDTLAVIDQDRKGRMHLGNLHARRESIGECTVIRIHMELFVPCITFRKIHMHSIGLLRINQPCNILRRTASGFIKIYILQEGGYIILACCISSLPGRQIPRKNQGYHHQCCKHQGKYPPPFPFFHTFTPFSLLNRNNYNSSDSSHSSPAKSFVHRNYNIIPFLQLSDNSCF